MLPKVTVGMPVYNGSRYLSAAIEALLAQTLEEFELIISDNASSDGTMEICRKYAAQDSRIRVHRNEENLGAARNYNLLVDLARGRYFKWASHDDLCAPKFLERCVSCLDAAPPHVVMCAPQTILIDAEGQQIGPYTTDLQLPEGRAYRRIARLVSRLQMCNCVFGVVRSEVLRTTRLIGSYPASDVVLLSELALRGQMWQVPEPLFYRRVHAEMSRQRHRDPLDVAAWFDPKGVHWTHRFAGTRRWWEQCRVIVEAPLPAHERALCLATAAWCRPVRAARVRVGAWRRRIFRRGTAESGPGLSCRATGGVQTSAARSGRGGAPLMAP